MFSRILIVFLASSAGLGAGSLIYYALFQDNMIFKGNNNSDLVGRILSFFSIVWFMIIVYLLHLNELPIIIVASVGMLITKLLWDIADGLRYASRIYEVLMSLESNSERAINYAKRANSHRQTQDLRAVAQTIFAQNSRQMDELENIITQHSQRQ